MKPQEVAQYKKAGRGFLITRNSATLADTDYEYVAKEIVKALNDQRAYRAEKLKAIFRGVSKEEHEELLGTLSEILSMSDLDALQERLP